MPVLRRLAEGVGATAYLGVVDGSDLLAVAVAEPPRSDVHVAYRLGSRMPLELGAAGRAVLAARTTGGRPLDPPWVVSTGDTPGSSGVATPVLGIPGVEAAVGVAVAGPVDEVGPRVARAAQEIARALG
jgi:DNA-binding IclR family transcriptional regulator